MKIEDLSNEEIINFSKNEIGVSQLSSDELLKLTFKNIDQISKLQKTLEENQINQRKIKNLLSSLQTVSDQLSEALDAPVAAQIVASNLQNAVQCALSCIFIHSSSLQSLSLNAVAGPDAGSFPNGFRIKSTKGIIGRAVRIGKSWLSEIASDPHALDEIFGSDKYQSVLLTPLYQNGFLEGIILLADPRPEIFSDAEMLFVETAGNFLTNSWERQRTKTSLTDLILLSSSLSTKFDFTDLLKSIAEISNIVLKSQFSVVIFENDGKFFVESSGAAPNLFRSIFRNLNSFFQSMRYNFEVLRFRDVRKDQRTQFFNLDRYELKSLLLSPMFFENETKGLILAFGRKRSVSFTDNDSFLAGLLASQASAAIQNCLHNIDNQTKIQSAQVLEQLTLNLSMSNNISEATGYFIQYTCNYAKAQAGGMRLIIKENQNISQIINSYSEQTLEHPNDLIDLSIQKRMPVTNYLSNNRLQICYPILIYRRLEGAIWFQIELNHENQPYINNELQLIIEQASLTLERTISRIDSEKDLKDKLNANIQLQDNIDHLLIAIISQLDKRNQEAPGHTQRVTDIAVKIGSKINLSEEELRVLRLSSLLHDIGKLGIKEEILQKSGSLSEQEWAGLKTHPELGKNLIKDISYLSNVSEIIYSHHERWDGSGYPLGLSGIEIPKLARIFAIADVYDALASDKPYRPRYSPSEARQFINEQSGTLFDPELVDAFNTLFYDPSIE